MKKWILLSFLLFGGLLFVGYWFFYPHKEPLHDAARQNDILAIEMLLRDGVKVDSLSRRGETPLVVAADFNSFSVAKLLIGAGANINAKGKRGVSVLQFFVMNGNVKAVSFLLDNGADINAQNDLGGTALIVAALHEHEELVRLLLGRGADPKIRSGRGRFALFSAVSSGGNVNIVRMLFEKCPEAIHWTNSYGATPLHVAATSEVVKFLIEKGAQVDARDNLNRTPLFEAAGARSPFLSLIFDRVKDKSIVNLRDSESGETPLHRAALYGKPQNVQLLVANGADVNAKNFAGKTVLDVAQSRVSRDAKRYNRLVAKPMAGTDLEVRGRKGRIASAESALKKSKDTVKILKEAGARLGSELASE